MIPSEGPAPPVICGENTGQHLYTSLTGAEGGGCVLLNLYISGAAMARTFSVKASQTVCGSGPPDGCLQWFEGTTGTVQSFNSGGAATHLAGQQYTVCVRREDGGNDDSLQYWCLQRTAETLAAILHFYKHSGLLGDNINTGLPGIC